MSEPKTPVKTLDFKNNASPYNQLVANQAFLQ